MLDFMKENLGFTIGMSIIIIMILLLGSIAACQSSDSSVHYIVAQYDNNKEVTRCWVTDDYDNSDNGAVYFKDRNELKIQENSTNIGIVRIPKEVGNFSAVAATIGVHDVGTCD